MSYLNPLRLHFAGQFKANISTVNNDPGHFDNKSFLPNYQQPMAPDGNPMNGWFNPQGDANFQLIGCTIGSAWTAAGQVASSDPVLGYSVADSDENVPAKLVDLDSEQQLTSEIWGLTVRIVDGNGNTLLTSDFAPAAFMDIWDRATGGGGDTNASAMYQSVLKNLQWADVSASPFLTTLKQAASTGLLSIKFNVDGINMTPGTPDFMCGRIVGTIGPAAAEPPYSFVPGRQFLAASGTTNPPPQFFWPAGGINHCVALVDAVGGFIYLDLGNALPSTIPGGPIDDLGDLSVGVYDPILTPGDPAGTFISFGTIPAANYAGSAWYTRTAGVAVLPLTPDQLALAAAAPLTIVSAKGSNIGEWPSGAFVRADRFVYRISPGDAPVIPVYATQWGNPLAGAAISFTLDPSQLQPSSGEGPSPSVGTPAGALTFNATAPTDASGIALLSLTAGDPDFDPNDPGTPHPPRQFADGYGIDGQVYGVRPGFADPGLENGPVNQWNFISFLLWSGFTPSNPVTWADIQPTLQQYANLYPVMLNYLNLADPASLAQNVPSLLQVFGLPDTDPDSMPVTRDLSPAKRSAIVSWLNNPNRDTAAPPPASAGKSVARASVSAVPAALALKGGKAAAAARRLCHQKGYPPISPRRGDSGVRSPSTAPGRSSPSSSPSRRRKRAATARRRRARAPSPSSD